MKAKRDWGHAKDYVEAMWLMLQQKKPDDFVIGTGKEHSVEDFAKKAFAHVGLNYKDHIISDKNLFRPAEVDTLLADSSKAKKILKWKPKITFDHLVVNMVERDLKYDQSERIGFMKIDETDFKSMTLTEKKRHLEVEGYVVLPDVLDSISIEKIKQVIKTDKKIANPPP